MLGKSFKLFAGAATASAVLGFSAAAFAQAAPQPDPPKPAAATEHEQKAKDLAGKDQYLLDVATKGFWCMSPAAGNHFRSLPSKDAAPPVQAFDNLYMFGTGYVSAYVLKTSAGLIMWDALDNEKEAREILEPGMKQFGLNMSDVKMVILTHGHADHFGGAKYLQDTYHLPIALSGPDWDIMLNTPPRPGGPTPPAKDKVLTDGQKITIGDTTVEVVLTPGHTPATVSSITTVKDKGVNRVVALWGGTAYPATMAGLGLMRTSIQHFKDRATASGAVALLNTHGFFDKLNERALARGNAPENPLVIGANRVQGSLAIYGECLESMSAWYTAMDRK